MPAMDPLQFSLFFCALLVAVALLLVRVARFEQHLQKLGHLRAIEERLHAVDDRLQMLAQTVERVRVDRIEGQLERLHADLEDLREVAANSQQTVVSIPAPAASQADGGGEPPVARLCAAVENRLLQLGYRDVQILNDLQRVDVAGDVELQVECWRGGMPTKGRVLVRNGAVRDVALQNVTQMFP